MNRIFIIGNLTADVEMRSTTAGVSVANFTVAVNRRKTDSNGNKEADFFKIVAWRQLGELCGKYLSKGKKVGIFGEMQSTSYKDRNGIDRHDWQIIAEEIEFLSAKEENHSAPVQQTKKAEFVQVDDMNDLPF